MAPRAAAGEDDVQRATISPLGVEFGRIVVLIVADSRLLCAPGGACRSESPPRSRLWWEYGEDEKGGRGGGGGGRRGGGGRPWQFEHCQRCRAQTSEASQKRATIFRSGQPRN